MTGAFTSHDANQSYSTQISEAYLSGQWMTERPGGSDVSMNETTATALPATARLSSDLGPPYALSGFKWFSSAAEGNIAIALARTGRPNSGSRGLSAFLVPLRVLPEYPIPLSNGIRMHRLKNKIGTHGLPTAEIELEGTRAWLIGNEGEGVKIISAMLNITRIHSAVHSVGSLRRALSIARSYARVRSIAGGKQLLMDNALHMATLTRVTLLYRALAHLTFENVRLLGKVECGTANEEEKARLRLLTPVLKAYAAMRAVGGMQECMAALGGQGYMEETGIGRLVHRLYTRRLLLILCLGLCVMQWWSRYGKAPSMYSHWT
jgi:alkylation response protein AidB-like acyl-CoA dehydrogenase